MSSETFRLMKFGAWLFDGDGGRRRKLEVGRREEDQSGGERLWCELKEMTRGRYVSVRGGERA